MLLYRFYSNPTWGHRMTIVGELRDEVLNIAVAITNEKETFVKRIGRAIAEGRLAKGKIYSSIKLPGKTKIMSEDFVKIAENIAIEKIKELNTRKERKRNGKN